MALSQTTTFDSGPIKLGATNVAVHWGITVPDGDSPPWVDMLSGSVYLHLAQTTGFSALYQKIAENDSDDDWQLFWINKDEGGRNLDAVLRMETDNKIEFRDDEIYMYSNADGELRISADTKVNVGDGTNQLVIKDDGEVNLDGTARVTTALAFPPGSWTDGGTAPTETRTGDYPGEAYTIDDSSLVTLRVPDNMDLAVDPTIRVYWYVNEAYAAASGEIQWKCAYSAAPSDETEAVDGAGYTGDLDAGDQNIPATAKFLTYTDIGTLTAASLAVGDMIGLEFSRVTLDDGTNPTAESVATLLEFRYTMNKLGATT